MNINFELYKVFYYVAKHLSFSRAAAQLYISQSAVSQEIKLLEKSLGCQLFNRSTKHVSLTPEGSALYRYIRQAFQLIKEGEQSINAFQELEQGEIRVGASDTICKYYLLPYFKKFHQLYPNIKIKIINGTSPACIELLQKNMVDLAVINIPPRKLPGGLEVQEVAKIQDAFLVGEKYSYLCQKTMSIAELQKYPFLLLEKHSVSRMYFDQLCAKHNVAITPEIELGNLDLLIELTKIGLGISFAVQEFVTEELAKGSIYQIPIQETIGQRKIGVLRPTRGIPSKAIDRFTELLMFNSN
ncbi:MAG: LysR family transcriptional regulator [Zhaonellaceae bacterium]|nr:LysR family transcriptional regulator [Clostridia bacterium]